jgi:diguanylate cyclase (GGDEF)-like protein
MIRHITHVYSDLATLQSEISSGELAHASAESRSVLVQVYSAENNESQIREITALIADLLPIATIVGATTVGEVAHGRLLTNQIVIGFTCFESSSLHVHAIPCASNTERDVGIELGKRIRQSVARIEGVLLLATPLSIDAAALLKGMEAHLGGCPVFGGGAGDYASMDHSLVFTDLVLYDKGAIAVVFTGEDLHIEPKFFLGWRPLSRSMTVTKVDGLYVESIDDSPAFDVYRHYLGIPNDDHFFLNALEFPFLLERNGELVARVPISADSANRLQFVADIHDGETFRIGYGDINLIVEDAKEIIRSMTSFSPQALFLYTCGCRRFLMQEDVELETLPFQSLAPTFGFYTYGEFFGIHSLSIMNSSMLVVGFREGPRTVPTSPVDTPSLSSHPLHKDPYSKKHTRVISRLLRFISAVTNELEDSNREVTKLSITDRLTQLVNRNHLEQTFDRQIRLANRYGSHFSVVLLDMDHFKQINDTHGHLAGDEVLIKIGQILISQTRTSDVVGRWGGEEFLIIASNTPLNGAELLAEKLRVAIEQTEIPGIGKVTASFGVAEYAIGDAPNKLVARADAALYTAKRAGRNRVETNRL